MFSKEDEPVAQLAYGRVETGTERGRTHAIDSEHAVSMRIRNAAARKSVEIVSSNRRTRARRLKSDAHNNVGAPNPFDMC